MPAPLTEATDDAPLFAELAALDAALVALVALAEPEAEMELTGPEPGRGFALVVASWVQVKLEGGVKSVRMIRSEHWNRLPSPCMSATST